MQKNNIKTNINQIQFVTQSFFCNYDHDDDDDDRRINVVKFFNLFRLKKIRMIKTTKTFDLIRISNQKNKTTCNLTLT